MIHHNIVPQNKFRRKRILKFFVTHTYVRMQQVVQTQTLNTTIIRYMIQRPNRNNKAMGTSTSLSAKNTTWWKLASFCVGVMSLREYSGDQNVGVSAFSPSTSFCSSHLNTVPYRRGPRDGSNIVLNSNMKLGKNKKNSQGGAGKKDDPEWKFLDTARVHVSGGDGGNGCVAFRREKGAPLGGPSGGRGGGGGNIYLQCDKTLNTLANLRNSNVVHYRAKPGKNGVGKNKDGSNAEDLYVPVPPGTLVRELHTQKLAGELQNHGETLLVARGGRGGRGNAAFQTPNRTSPKLAERGQPGAKRWISLELRLLADVGLIGKPNAGKSTLLAASTQAKPKIANYPFTTITPNLGVCDETGLVLLDIPGLLEGASQGIGMGFAFLRHITRCQVLLHIIDVSASFEEAIEDYKVIQQELEQYDPSLKVDKPQVIVLNKIDTLAPDERDEKIKQLTDELKKVAGHTRILPVSAATTSNVKELMQRLKKFMDVEQKKKMAESSAIVELPPAPEIDFSKSGLEYDSDDYGTLFYYTFVLLSVHVSAYLFLPFYTRFIKSKYCIHLLHIFLNTYAIIL